MQNKSDPEKLDASALLPQPMLPREEMEELRQESQAAMREFRKRFKRQRQKQC